MPEDFPLHFWRIIVTLSKELEIKKFNSYYFSKINDTTYRLKLLSSTTNNSSCAKLLKLANKTDLIEPLKNPVSSFILVSISGIELISVSIFQAVKFPFSSPKTTNFC